MNLTLPEDWDQHYSRLSYEHGDLPQTMQPGVWDCAIISMTEEKPRIFSKTELTLKYSRGILVL